MTTDYALQVEVYPATAERWPDLEQILSQRRATSSCWCMFWRLRRTDFSKLTDDEKKAALKAHTADRLAPGVLAYVDGKVIGWCSVGPRENFVALENSRILKRVDDTPVWSIVCFFVDTPFRKKGVMAELLRGAVRYAEQNGAQVIESYPLEMQSDKLAGQKLHGFSGYMGIASVFRAAGFVKVSDASETQVIMRYTVA
ncbi:MAG TPA: GNAT family N-acetyltransferase [Anaerolineaceae bacterium]|nr:GNAT family N-acetyltransferase [Anaerolineaceae bacterium]HQF62127.1 GNAT family N-acetyltransferase [Anaerolineaceae bacterium]HQH84859.1 GNAT family N-acetyltransferase [Anaerolineaceae bacterium]